MIQLDLRWATSITDTLHDAAPGAFVFSDNDVYDITKDVVRELQLNENDIEQLYYTSNIHLAQSIADVMDDSGESWSDYNALAVAFEIAFANFLGI